MRSLSSTDISLRCVFFFRNRTSLSLLMKYNDQRQEERRHVPLLVRKFFSFYDLFDRSSNSHGWIDPPWWCWNGCGPLKFLPLTGLLFKTLSTSYGHPQNGQIRKFSFARELCKKFANFRAFCTRVANKKLRISRRFSVYHVTPAAANRKPALRMLARGPSRQRAGWLSWP